MSRSLSSQGLKAVSFAAAVIGALAVSTAPLRAQEGFYGSLQTGAAFLGNMTSVSPAGGANLSLDPGTAWTVGGAVGYRFAQPVRLELSVDYLDGSLKGAYSESGVFVPCGTFPAQPCLGPGVEGDLNAWSGFAMGYYDLDLGNRLTPYVGAGVGLVRAGLDVETTARLNVGTSSEFDIIDDNDTELGYRVAAGVAYDIPGGQVDVGYTYTTTNRPSYAGKGSGVPSFTFNRRLSAHAVKAGMRFGF